MLKKILSCLVSREVIVIALISCLCLKDQLDLCSINCHKYAMAENCSASLEVLAASGFCDGRKPAFTIIWKSGFT